MVENFLVRELSVYEEELSEIDIDFLFSKPLWKQNEFIFLLIGKESPNDSNIDWEKYPNIKKINELFCLDILDGRIREKKRIKEEIFFNPSNVLNWALNRKFLSEELHKKAANKGLLGSYGIYQINKFLVEQKKKPEYIKRKIEENLAKPGSPHSVPGIPGFWPQPKKQEEIKKTSVSKEDVLVNDKSIRIENFSVLELNEKIKSDSWYLQEAISYVFGKNLLRIQNCKSNPFKNILKNTSCVNQDREKLIVMSDCYEKAKRAALGEELEATYDHQLDEYCVFPLNFLRYVLKNKIGNTKIVLSCFKQLGYRFSKKECWDYFLKITKEEWHKPENRQFKAMGENSILQEPEVKEALLIFEKNGYQQPKELRKKFSEIAPLESKKRGHPKKLERNN